MADGTDGNKRGTPAEARPAGATAPAVSLWVRLPRYLLAFVIGAIGAVIFVYFRLPLPWYLGALTACLIASVVRPDRPGSSPAGSSQPIVTFRLRPPEVRTVLVKVAALFRVCSSQKCSLF